MNLLFTGASSFTGFGFVRSLADAGHTIYATFRQKSHHDYDGLRAERVKQVLPYCQPIWDCQLGDEKFLNKLHKISSIDVLCYHHAALMDNYRSLEYDILQAVTENTHNIKKIFNSLKEKGLHHLVYTGSIFEKNEGTGTLPLHAVLPYGLTKGLTADIIEYWCQQQGVRFAKFVIPNPFGPYEALKFTSYLAQSWLQKKVPMVKTPDYVRDNIHSSLLSLAYTDFIGKLFQSDDVKSMNPSCYVESQGAFSHRVADEMQCRFNVECPLNIHQQNNFDEPLIRINTDSVRLNQTLKWDESKAWDALADFYLKYYA